MKITTRSLGSAAVFAALGGLTFLSSIGARCLPEAAAQNTGPTSKLAYQWKNVAVVGGGFVSGIITHPKEKGLMYARTDVGGAYRWDDKAKRWIPLTDAFGGPLWNFTGIESIALDPTDANRVYMAVGTYTNNWAGNGAILRSTDRGNTWQRTDLPFKNGGNEEGRFAGERLVVDPNMPEHLFFGTRNEGLWQSHDRGATWNKSPTFPIQGRTNVVGIAFVLFDATTGKSGKTMPTLYAGVSSKEAGLYRSDDNGATWKPVPGQPKGMLVNHGVLSGDGVLYLTYGDAVGPNGMGDGALWKLNTRTGAWTDVTPQQPGGDDKFGYGGVSVDAHRPTTLVAVTMDRWAHKDTIFRTTDGGAHWSDIGPKSERDSTLSPYLNWGRPTADLGHWIGDIEIDPFDSDHVLYVTGATIWASNDLTNADKGQPTHWTVGANGLEETVPTGVISPPEGAPLLSSMGDIDGFRHVDLTISPRNGFHQPTHGTCTGIDFAEKNPKMVVRVFSGAQNGAYSEDNGITWTDFGATAPGNGKGSIAVSADGGAFIWTPEGNSGVFYSHDKGTTWAAANGLPKPTRVFADREDPKRFYAFVDGTVYVSADSGVTFAAKATDLAGNEAELHAVPGHAGDVWLVIKDSGVLHSTDGGATFTKLDALRDANRIGFGKAAPGRDYPAVFVVGTLGDTWGFYRSDDAGKTWVRINDDRHAFHYINAITGDPRVYGRVYLATGGRGVIVGDVTGK